MAKESNVGKDRLGEVFSVLSEGGRPRGGEGGNPPPAAAINPWKVATFLLLLVSLAVPMAFSIRESGRQEERERRVERARGEAAAAREHLDKGLVGAATLGLGKVVSELADLPDADRVVREIAAEYSEQVRAREHVQADLSHYRRVAAVLGKSAEQLLAGDVDGAAQSLAREAETAPAARGFLTLTKRLVRWDLAARSKGPARGISLAALAGDWPLPALIAASTNERERTAVRDRVQRTLERLRAALAQRSLEVSRSLLGDVLRDSQLTGLDDLLEELNLLERLSLARGLRGRGEIEAAAAVFSALDAEGVEEAAVPAEELSEELRVDWLRGALRAILERAEQRGAHLDAAVLEGSLAVLDGRERPDLAKSAGYGKWLAGRASRLLSRGELHAALAVGREAADLGSEAAKRFVAKLERRLADQAAADALARAREAAEHGACGHARSVLRDAGVQPPADLSKELARIERDADIATAYSRLGSGDGGAAALLLEKAGVGGDPELRAALGRARLLEGKIEEGLSLLPEKPVLRMMELVRAAVSLPVTDRAGFAGLIRRAIEVTGPREDLQAALALALEETGRREEAAEIWKAVRDAALKRAPLAGPENEAEPKTEPGLPEEKPEGG